MHSLYTFATSVCHLQPPLHGALTLLSPSHGQRWSKPSRRKVHLAGMPLGTSLGGSFAISVCLKPKPCHWKSLIRCSLSRLPSTSIITGGCCPGISRNISSVGMSNRRNNSMIMNSGDFRVRRNCMWMSRNCKMPLSGYFLYVCFLVLSIVVRVLFTTCSWLNSARTHAVLRLAAMLLWARFESAQSHPPRSWSSPIR